MQSLVTLLKDSLIYGIGSAITRFISLFSFPLYAHVLSKHEFAHQDLTLTFVTLAAIIATLGIDNGYARFFYSKDKDKNETTLFWFFLGIASFTAFFCIIFSSNLAFVLLEDSGKKNFLILAAVIVFLRIMTRPHLLSLRLNKKPIKFSIVSFSTALAQLGAIIYFVRVKELGALGVMYSIVTSSAVSCVVASFLAGWLGRGMPCLIAFTRMIKFGFPLFISGLFLWGIDSFSLFLVQYGCTEHETADFGVAKRIASLVGIALFGFQMGWGPIAYEKMNNPNEAKAFFSQVSLLYWIVASFLLLGIQLFSKEIITLLAGSQYVTASIHVPYLVLGGLLWGYLYIVSIGYQYANKTYHQLIGMALGVVAVLIGGCCFTGRYGAISISISVMVGYVLCVMYCTKVSKLYLSVNYKLLHSLSAILTSCVLMRICYTFVGFESSYLFKALLIIGWGGVCTFIIFKSICGFRPLQVS